MHATPLISTLVLGLVLAFGFGLVAQRLRLPPLIGYLVAGIAIGPFTPGFVADQAVANQLAEIGVILLMFGVGLHFSLADLLSVRAIAIPGALAQALVATPLGVMVGWWQGWPLAAGLIFGIGLSVASTVVLLRALQERRLIETKRGRIAVGWLIVEDLVMVLTLVLLPALAGLLGGEGAGAPGLADVAATTAITIAKVAAFVAIMLIVGKRVVPWVLHYMAHTGSRELFRLSVFVIALGAAYAAAELFGVSFALGAFFAGMIMSESALSQQAAQETLPLRDAFAVLFFVSVGMLFDPAILIDDPLPVVATLAIILLGKTLAAFAIVRLSGYPASTALLISVSLAQIGEFSFILAGLGVELGLLPVEGRNYILAGAILSILVNPLLFAGLDVKVDRGGGYLAQGFYASMGFGVPGALGAGLAAPDRRPIALVGDGGFQMTACELSTAAQEGIKVKVAILNNAYLGMVRQWQELFYEERYSEVYLSPDLPDYVKWAEAMGCEGIRVDHPEEVEPAIEKANAIDDRPVVIDFRTDYREKVYPMVPAGHSNDEIILDPAHDTYGER